MRQRCEQGMTLMELLVAMVIGSLVITLVVRGLGMSLNLYERVASASANMDIAYRESLWWADSVASLIPCTDPAHCVEGSTRQFRGYTLAPTARPSGMRMPVIWSIGVQDGETRLMLAEGPEPERMGHIVMHLPLPEDAHFAYLTPNGQWLEQWTENNSNQRLPVAIRIEDGQGNTWALAATAQRPYGRGDYRDVVGM